MQDAPVLRPGWISSTASRHGPDQQPPNRTPRPLPVAEGASVHQASFGRLRSNMRDCQHYQPHGRLAANESDTLGGFAALPTGNARVSEISPQIRPSSQYAL